MKKGKLVGLMAIFLVSVLALCGMSYALPITIEEVKINDDAVATVGTPTPVYDFERNQNLDVKVRLRASTDIDNVQIEASIRGYDHPDTMDDLTDVFDMKENVTYTKKLSIPLRQRMDQDRYNLRVRVENRDGSTSQYDYVLVVDTKRHQVNIKDVILSPEGNVRQGRALLATVRVHNYGQKDEEGIKIKVSIPELGLSASDFIDELQKDGDDDDEETSEELYLRIPNCAEAGRYDVKVEVSYDDGDGKETKTVPIEITEGDVCEAVAATEDKKPATEKTIITIGPETQDVSQGGNAIYPITLTNAGSASKTYTVSVDAANWGKFSISPSNVVVLDAGESKAVYIYASPNADAQAGEQMFAVTVKSNDKTLKQVTLKANVVAQQASGLGKLKKALEIGLVVLVVLLVILGLIIGFNKLRGSDDEETKEDSTYY